MPLLSLSAPDALERLKQPAARWPDGRRDGRRLDGIVLPGVSPSFRLRPGEAILTMGSCFARNIEVRLAELGFRVPALELQLPDEERGSDTPNDLLNKYNPQSMVNELRWAFGDPYPNEAYLRLGPAEWHDPHLAGNVKPAPLPRLRARRNQVTRLFRRLPRCRALVVTLGLVEAWFDNHTGLYLNTAPPAVAVVRAPKRFRLDVLGHEEVLAELERLWALVQAHGHPRARMLLTVSPVPMRATYTGDDVLVANNYSKSVLRAAAGAFAAAHKEVDYFPSYEAATLTARGVAFQEDNRHVAAELVHAIMDRVIERYGPPAAEDGAPPAEPDDTAGLPLAVRLRKHIQMGRRDEARAIMARLEPDGNFAAAGYDEFGFRLTYAKLLAERGAVLEASIQLDRCIALNPDSAMAHMAQGRLLARLHRPLRAQHAFARVVALDPGNVDARVRLARMQLRNDQVADAEATALAAQAMAINNTEVAELLTEIGVAGARGWDNESPETHPDQDVPSPTGLLRIKDRMAAFLNPPDRDA